MHDPTQKAHDDVPASRGIYCNRTLNLRSIEAIGYDMDYTLVHYETSEWEARAFEFTKKALAENDWPVEDLEFDAERVIRGLVIDRERGNVVKANDYGYIKQAAHGTRMLAFGETRDTYSREIVDLSEDRWIFINTLFSISAASMYLQLVDRLDRGELGSAIGYDGLWDRVQEALDTAHLEGVLKNEIMSDPERYVRLDPEMPQALLDQRAAGNILMLITNSGWTYSRFMMSYAFDRYLPDGMTWRDLFEIKVVSAGKPDFFLTDKPIFKLATEDGLVRPIAGSIPEDGIYLGGNASLIEDYLGVSGDRVLFVGDHIVSDVNVTKEVLRWRTALVVRELEREIEAIRESVDRQRRIQELMDAKVEREAQISRLRLARQRDETEHSPAPESVESPDQGYVERIDELRDEVRSIDDRVGPLVGRDGKDFNEHWGYLMRAGNDKAQITRQIERYADIYTSRVSNFLRYTPNAYFRAPRESLPHDRALKRQVDDPGR